MIGAIVFDLDGVVVRSSANGVRAAAAAGTNVIAFATPFTTKSLHETKVVEHDRILHEPDKLLDMVRVVIEEHEDGGDR